MSNGGQIRYSVGFDVNKAGLNELKASLQQLRQMSDQDLLKLNPAMAHTAKAEIDKIKTSIKQVDDAFSKAFNSNLGTLNVAKLNQELKKLNLQKIEKDFSHLGATGSTAFRNLATQAMTTNTQLKQSHTLLEKMGKTMANTMKWGLASSVMNSFSSGIRQAYGYVKNLDRSLNDIRIVTGLSAEEMDKFATKANKAAQALGQTTTNYTDAALIYYQQGLAGKEVEERAEVTLKAANVTGQSGAEVSEQLTAVWNGYKVSAEETELYIDKLAAVAASTASDLEELSTGMSKVASAANVAGVDIDQLNATLSTVISVTRQAPETVGTAFKTIYARMGDLAVDGVDEFGTTLGSVSSKMKTMGIEVTDESGNLRDMGTIVEEVAAKWDTWTEAQKQAAAVAMAGKRQYNNLIALFDNWEMYEDSLLTSANAAGTLQRQQDIYMESTQAHLKTLKSSAENLYDSILDPKAINTVADGLSIVANAAAGFVDAIGGGIPLLLTLGSIGGKVFSQQLATGIATYVNNLKIAREQTQHLQAEAQITQQFKGVSDKQIQTLVGMKEQVLALDKSITNEERNQTNEMIKQHSTLMSQAEELQKQVNIAADLHQRLTGVQAKTNTETGRKATISELESQQKEFEGLTRGFKDYQNKSAAFKQLMASERSASNDLSQRNSTSAGSEYRKAIQQQADGARQLLELDQLSAEQKEKLGKAYDNFINITKKGTGINLTNSKVVRSAAVLEQAYQEAVEKTVQEIKESTAALREHEAAQKKNKAALTQSQQAYQTFIQNINFRAAIQQSINMVSSIGQVAMAINSLAGLGSIIKNEDLSAGEKFLQILTTLGFMVPMFATGVTGLVNAFKAENGIMTLVTAAKLRYAAATSASGTASMAEASSIKVSLGAHRQKLALQKQGISSEMAYKLAVLMTAGTEAQAARAKEIANYHAKHGIITKTQETSVNNMLSASNLGVATTAKAAGAAMKTFLVTTPILGIVAALAALTAALVIYNKHADKAWGKAVEKAGENLDSLGKELESVKQLTSDVQSNLEGWKSAQDTLKTLTKGTAEWKQALIETNSYILELLNNYPELAQYISTDANGIMSISQGGIDYLVDTTTSQLEAAQRSQAQGNVEYLEAKNNEIRQGQSEHFTDIPEMYEEDLISIVKYAEQYGTSFLALGEESLKELGGIFNDATLRKVVLDYGAEIEAGVEALAANNTAIEAYTDQIISSALAGDEKFEALDADTQVLVQNEYAEQYNKAYDEAYAKLVTKEQIRNAHMEDLGASDVRESETKGYSEYKVGNEWIEVSDEAAKMAAASEDAAFELEDFTTAIYEAGSGLLWFREQLLGNNKNMSDNEANTIAGFHQGDDFLTGVENLSDTELADLIARTNGKGDNDYKISQAQAEAAGYTGTDAVEKYLADLCQLAREERDARKQAEETQKIEGVDAVAAGRNESGGFSGRKGTEKWNSLGGAEGIYKSTEGQRRHGGKIEESGWDWDAVLPENVSPADIINKIDWSQAPDDPEGFQNWYKEQAGKGIQNAQLDTKIEAEGLDVAEVESYAEHLQSIADTHEDIADSLDEDPLAAKKIAANSKRAAKGMEDFKKTIETYEDVLTSGNKASEKWSQAATAVRENMADILSLSDEDMGWMTDDYIAENLDDIKKAADGDVEAIQNLWAEAGKQHLIDIGLDIPQDQFDEMNSLIDQIADEDIEIGATIDKSQYAMALFDMMTAAGATAEEIQGQFDSIGWEPETETRTITLSKKDVRKGKVTVPSQVSASEDGEIIVDHQELPIDSSLQAGDTFTYTVIKGKGGKKNFTPNMTRKTTASIGGGGSSKGGGGGGGGGGSKPKKTYKTSEKKKDRYREVNNSLKELGTELDRLAERQEKLFGKDLLNNLNKQLDVMKKQVEVTREKLAIAQAEAKEMRTQRLANQEPGIYNDLLDFGIKFDENGEIINYEAVIDKWDNEVKRLTDKWNSMSAAEQEADADKENGISAQLERAEKNRDTLLQLIGDYDELLYDKIPGLMDEVTKLAYDMITIQIEKFNIEVGLRMDMTEAIKDWREFEREVIKDLDTDQLVDWGKSLVQEAQDVINTGVIETATSDLEKKMAFAQEVLSGDTSKISANNPYASFIDGVLQTDAEGNAIIDKTAMWEDIDKSREEIQENLEFLRDQENELEDAYYSSIDAIGEAVDKQAEAFERVNDTLNHTVNLLEMIKGEAIYADKAQVYDQMFTNNLQALEAERKAELYYREEYEKAIARGATKEEIEQWEDLWLDAQDNVREAAEQTVEILTERFSNAVLKAIDDMDKALTDGRGLDSIQLEWEMNIDDDDRYLDSVNKAFAIQDLNNKITQSINETDSLSAQKRLNDLRDKELTKLREKEKLTQYDVDRANQLYEIELKKIALDEAQKNKSQMRLRRDASGNYSYQFVADQDSITEAQNELMEAYNNLYNMDKEQRKEMEQNIMDLQNALKESMQEFSELSVEEQKARRGEYERIWAHYNEQIADIAEEATVAQSNLIESTHDAIASTFRDMSETERQIMAEEMVPHFSEAVDTMIAKINGNNGLGDALNTAIGDIFDASQALADGIGMIESTLDLDSGSLSNITSSYYADAAQGAKDYAAAQQENIDKAKEEKAIMLELWDTIKLVTQGYLDMASAATQAVQAAAELKTATYGSEADDIADERSTSPRTATTATKNNVAEVGDTATLNVGGYTDSSDGKGAAHTDAVNTKVKIAKIEPGAASPYQIAKLDGGILGWVTLDQLTGYDTGGYTGSWNDRSGRLALLHQKELVLNERDTKNILTAVEAIRDISAPNSGSSIASILASISKWTESISNMLAGRSNALSQYSSSISEAIGASMLNMNTDNSGDNSTSIEIHADFPAATSTYEIEAAFNSLINNASQYTHSTRR